MGQYVDASCIARAHTERVTSGVQFVHRVNHAILRRATRFAGQQAGRRLDAMQTRVVDAVMNVITTTRVESRRRQLDFDRGRAELGEDSYFAYVVNETRITTAGRYGAVGRKIIHHLSSGVRGFYENYDIETRRRILRAQARGEPIPEPLPAARQWADIVGVHDARRRLQTAAGAPTPPTGED